ncbi:hypothetical protein BP6252_00245 [Coleophoma cylindrospora]|uniref:Vacuolar protein sorting-associated protein 54 n=1 Tax=Coleophoma cylindrospora TaxID=1849047 RepID=A0A3D8SPF8_9HELO|nr:hypothetical protein BP6252_00245 [Coleophoma cylindrospora]
MPSESPAPSISSRLSVDGFSPLSPPRNEYPFPRSGSFAARRGSTASSIHSVGGALDTSSSWHGLSESGQNAISTLLQAPIVRTGLLPHTSAPASSTHKPPTARDIPPVVLTNIQHVEPKEFQSYLTQVAPLYDALQRAKENEEDGGTQLLRKASAVDDFADLLEETRSSSRRPNVSRKASLASLASSIESPMPRRRSSGGLGRRSIHAPSPLSTIPNVYFEDEFHLENPRTFDVVSERSEVVRPAPGTADDRRASAIGRKALATNAILQEKLSWYMDTIEVHLISSISSASTSFFAALGSLRELHTEAADSVGKIKALRKELETLDDEMAVGGLNIVNKRRRRENLKKLSDAVLQLKMVVEAIANCEALVDSGDVEKALDTIDDLEKLISGEELTSQPERGLQLIDLRGATALEGVTGDMDILRLRIGKAYESRFLDTLLGDLKRHVESVSTTEIFQRWSNASQRSRGGHNREPSAHPTYLSMSDGFRAELTSSLNGLHRARYTTPATAVYRESVLREIRYIIKRPMPASNDDDNDSMMSASTVGGGKHLTQQEKSTILARNLRNLEAEDAEELLTKIYIGVGETLRRLGTQVKMLLDVTSTLGDPMEGLKSPPRSPNFTMLEARKVTTRPRASSRAMQEEIHQALDMSNLLGQAVDIAQERIVKILRVRSEQSTHLAVDKFLRYFTLNLLFANECEAVSGRGGTALKNVVNNHIKEYVQHLSESERQKLAEGMGDDPWNAKDFNDVDKEQLDRILSASTRDAEVWSAGSKIWIQPAAQVETPTNGTAQANGSVPGKEKTRSATIESESFILPVSAILCMHGLSQFLHLNAGIPSMTLELGTSMVSYLTLFNSRCTQLILGAGATRSAGLKNITTKHLALAAQALAFISALIPHLREFIRRHAGMGTSVSTLMGEFDKVRRAFQEHQQSIYDKLVDIMSGRATTHMKAMKLIDWEASSATGPNQYMETLTKETITLHKVLSKHLPEHVVQMIMEPVFKSYKEQLSKAFGDVVLASEEAKERMLRDAQHLKTKIGHLGGSGDTADYLINVVKNKTLPKAVAPPPPPAKEPPKETSQNAATNGTKETESAQTSDSTAEEKSNGVEKIDNPSNGTKDA